MKTRTTTRIAITAIERSDDWITPRWLLELLGPFDMDPCASAAQPWSTARRMVAPPEDGLGIQWEGVVWLNPPYSRSATWISRLAEHGSGIALVPASVETKWFYKYVWACARMVFFPMGRPMFCRPDKTDFGDIGRGCALVAYGSEAAARFLKVRHEMGGVVVPKWYVTTGPTFTRRGR